MSLFFILALATILVIFDRRTPKKHFCNIILKSVHWPRRRFRFKVFVVLALVAIWFSGEEVF